MLVLRLRRWPNIKPALVQCLVLAGRVHVDTVCCSCILSSTDQADTRRSINVGLPLDKHRSPADTRRSINVGLPLAQRRNPADTRRSMNVGITLVLCRRRWTNVKTALIQRLVPALDADHIYTICLYTAPQTQKMQYLLACEVNRYCFLVLHGSACSTVWWN